MTEPAPANDLFGVRIEGPSPAMAVAVDLAKPQPVARCPWP